MLKVCEMSANVWAFRCRMVNQKLSSDRYIPGSLAILLTTRLGGAWVMRGILLLYVSCKKATMTHETAKGGGGKGGDIPPAIDYCLFSNGKMVCRIRTHSSDKLRVG